MIIVGSLVVVYIVAITVGKKTSKIRPGQYYAIALLALLQALIVLIDLVNTPLPKP